MNPAAARGRRPARWAPKKVLLWVVLVSAVAVGVYTAAPWILPARIYEGPLVQQASENAATLVWFTTRPVDCALVVTIDGVPRTLDVQSSGCRHVATVLGLGPATSYPYEIRAGARRLCDALAFRTNRAAADSFAFVVFGDSGKGSRAQYLLAQQMQRVDPPADFALHTGDVVYPDGARHRYESRFFAPYRPMLARIGFWPCLGNHDVDEAGRAGPYCDVFELPDNGPPGLPADHNYWFDYASCRVAVIDSNVDAQALASHITPWLREIMAAPGPRWRFVAFHHPPYTGGKYPEHVDIQRELVPAMEDVGIDAVFNGHDHNYQRTWPLRAGQIVEDGTGIVYVVTGAGGAALYAIKRPTPAYLAAHKHAIHSFTHVAIDNDTLTLRQIDVNGAIIDQCTWRKPSSVELPAPGPPGDAGE